jgi:hypothetical protein
MRARREYLRGIGANRANLNIWLAANFSEKNKKII